GGGGGGPPPLLMALDEIVQTCPVPLPAWLADSGGKGIQLIPVAHGEAQLRTRWGRDGAQVVLDTCGVKIWLPGITDTTTLKMASELCGQAAFTERVRVGSLLGESRTERRRVWHDAMTPDMVRQLPVGHALVIRGSHTPVIAGAGLVGKDRAYRAARRAGAAIAPIAPVREPAAQPRPVTPAMANAQRRLQAVPDLDVEAAGEARGDDPPAYPWN